ncbi:MAG TPA: hypothetical protein VF996_02755 [Candidatus Saccharimonadales bacterium]
MESSEQKYLWQVENRDGTPFASIMEFADNDSPLDVPQTVLELQLELGSLSLLSESLGLSELLGASIKDEVKEVTAKELAQHILDFARAGDVVKLRMPKGPEVFGQFLVELAGLNLPDSLQKKIQEFEDDWPGFYL